MRGGRGGVQGRKKVGRGHGCWKSERSEQDSREEGTLGIDRGWVEGLRKFSFAEMMAVELLLRSASPFSILTTRFVFSLSTPSISTKPNLHPTHTLQLSLLSQHVWQWEPSPRRHHASTSDEPSCRTARRHRQSAQRSTAAAAAVPSSIRAAAVVWSF